MPNKDSTFANSPLNSIISKLTLNKLSIVCLATAITMIGCSETQQEQATQTLGLDAKDVFSLKVGTCFNEPNPSDMSKDEDSDLIAEVPIRECNKPHDNEVFHLFDLPDTAALPDNNALNEIVLAECSQAYAAYVGKSFEDTKYDMGFMSPGNDTWLEGDREIVCYIYSPDAEQITVSLKGANL